MDADLPVVQAPPPVWRHNASAASRSRLWRPHLRSLHRGCSLHSSPHLHHPGRRCVYRVQQQNLELNCHSGDRAAQRSATITPRVSRASIFNPPPMLRHIAPTPAYLHGLTATGAHFIDRSSGRGSVVRLGQTARGTHARCGMSAGRVASELSIAAFDT